MPEGTPFGPGIASMIAYLHGSQMIGFKRLTEVCQDLSGVAEPSRHVTLESTAQHKATLLRCRPPVAREGDFRARNPPGLATALRESLRGFFAASLGSPGPENGPGRSSGVWREP
jgi:hypothetical protein